MRKLIFVAALLLTAAVALGQEKWPINQNTVSSTDQLRRLLTNRFSLVEDDIENLESLARLGRAKIFYVCSVTGADTYTGEDKDHPLATVDAAVNKCTANRGDIIIVMQNHAQTLAGADAVDVDVAGVTVIGLGTGDDRPTFTFDTNTDEFVIGRNGDNVTIYNLAFFPSVNQCAHGIDVEDGADNVAIINCEFLESATTATANEFLKMITVAVEANDLTIQNCRFTSADAAGCTDAIEIGDGVATRFKLIGCKFHGAFATAALFSDTVCTDALLLENVFSNTTTTVAAVSLTGAWTGFAIRNSFYADTWGTAGVQVFDPGSLSCIENYGATAADKPGSIIPSVSLGQDIHQWLNGADGMSTWLAGAKPANGVSLAEGLRYLVELFANGTPATITAPGTNLTILDIIGGNGTTTTGATAASVLGAIGTNEAAGDTLFASSSVEDDGDGSVLEREEHIQSDTDKIDGATLGNPVANSMAAFVAGGNGGLGTQLAASKSLVDAIGTNGSTVQDVNTTIAGIIGKPTDTDHLTDSSNVSSNRDGSIFERLEFLCKYFETGTPGALVAPANTMSLLDILGTNGTTTTGAVAGSILGAIGTNEATGATDFASATVAADKDGSVLERSEAMQVAGLPTYNHPNYFVVTVDVNSATWNTAASHEVVTVTGACRVQIMIECTESIACTGSDSTFAFGFEGNTAAIVAATDWDSGAAALAAGDVVSAVYGATCTTPASGANTSTGITGALFDVVVVGGKHIGYTIGTADADNGTVLFHAWWQPLSATGACTAGNGAAL